MFGLDAPEGDGHADPPPDPPVGIFNGMPVGGSKGRLPAMILVVQAMHTANDVCFRWLFQTGYRMQLREETLLHLSVLHAQKLAFGTTEGPGQENARMAYLALERQLQDLLPVPEEVKQLSTPTMRLSDQ